MTQHLRLDRLLSNLGYGSRKDAQRWVAEGLITRDRQPITKADMRVPLEEVRQGRWQLHDEPLDPPTPMVVMLHKPQGYICSHDEQGLLAYDLLPHRWRCRKPALSIAGRLDKESTGQLIITDDGQLLHKIIHPRSHAIKTYQVTLADPLQGDETSLFASGNFLMRGDDKPLKPADWQPTGSHGGVMRLSEGRFHQIRRMFQTLGNQVTALHRSHTGALELGDLPEGHFRQLTTTEVSLLLTPPPASDIRLTMAPPE